MFLTSGSLTCFAGYSRSIPGIPRYNVLGSDLDGIFSLQITNVTLEDDADYECQVGPANFNRPIREKAHLSVLRKIKETVCQQKNALFSFVLVPPTSIEIVGHRAGSRIDIRENEEVEVTCKVQNAKPKASIVWYRKDSRFVTGKQFSNPKEGLFLQK